MQKLIKFSVAAIMLLGVLSSCNTPVKEQAKKEETKSFSSKDKIAQASSDMIMHPEYAKSIASTAYIWGYPMVNMINRRNSITQVPKPGRLGGVLPVAPLGQIGMLYDYIAPEQNFVTCTNQDVVYGLGFFSLDQQPVVLQVPEVGDRFWIYAIYDARTDQVGHLGKPYSSKPGFYLLAGPNWDGKVPAGINEVIKSPTALANIAPRFFMNDTDEDRAAIQPLLNQVVVYPLSEFNGQMKTIVWKEAPAIPNPNESGGGEAKWVVPEKFFDQLGEVLETIPPLPGEETLYGQFKALIKVANNNPEIKTLITETVVELDKSLIQDFLKWKYNGKPAGNGWNRSVNNAEWGLDYFNRTGTARSNMFDNRPSETQYFFTDNTSADTKMVGRKNYKITFKAGELPPMKGFWSMTLYNEHHFFHLNDLKRYSLGTKNKSLKYGDDGSLILYAGNKNPGKDKESNWLPSPEGEFSLYIRAYWGKQGIIDGSWVPPVIEEY